MKAKHHRFRYLVSNLQRHDGPSGRGGFDPRRPWNYPKHLRMLVPLLHQHPGEDPISIGAQETGLSELEAEVQQKPMGERREFTPWRSIFLSFSTSSPPRSSSSSARTGTTSESPFRGAWLGPRGWRPGSSSAWPSARQLRVGDGWCPWVPWV